MVWLINAYEELINHSFPFWINGKLLYILINIFLLINVFIHVSIYISILLYHSIHPSIYPICKISPLQMNKGLFLLLYIYLLITIHLFVLKVLGSMFCFMRCDWLINIAGFKGGPAPCSVPPAWRWRWGPGRLAAQPGCSRWGSGGPGWAPSAARTTGRCGPCRGRSPAPPPWADMHTCNRQYLYNEVVIALVVVVIIDTLFPPSGKFYVSHSLIKYKWRDEHVVASRSQ